MSSYPFVQHHADGIRYHSVIMPYLLLSCFVYLHNSKVIVYLSMLVLTADECILDYIVVDAEWKMRVWCRI